MLPGRVLFHPSNGSSRLAGQNDRAEHHDRRRRVWRATSSCRDKTELQRGRPVGGRLEGELLALCLPDQLDCRRPETGLARPKGLVELACCYFQSDRAARQNGRGCSVCSWGCWCGGVQKPWLLDRIGVRDIHHLVYQTTAGWGPRAALGWATSQTPTHLSTHICKPAHGQDVTVGQDMIVVQEPADREGWSGGGMSYLDAQPRRPQWPARTSAGCRAAQSSRGWATNMTKWVDEATSRPSIQPS